MDDLAGLYGPTSPSAKPTPSSAPPNAYLSLKPSPLSSRTVSPAPPTNGAPKSSDSFSNLVSFGNKKVSSNMSLLEQQKLREEQKRKEVEESAKKMDALFGGSSSAAWDSLGNGSSASPAPPVETTDDDDILAAFRASAPVDKSSHYPPPSASSSRTELMGDNGGSRPAYTQNNVAEFDPFDVDALAARQLPFQAQSISQAQNEDDDDILGDLAKPVSELPPRKEPTPPPEVPQAVSSPIPAGDPRDSAIAEIMEMGFSTEKAKEALANTDTGLDVEQAVGWILEEAHRSSRPASSATQRERRPERSSSTQRPSASRQRSSDRTTPAWARDQGQEKDIGAYAAEIGGNLFKSANSFWNTSKKKMEKTIAEFQSDLADGGGDPNMPKWMREKQIREQLEARGAKGMRKPRPEPERREERAHSQQRESEKATPNLTDEAMMLELGSGPPQQRRKQREDRPPPRPDGLTREVSEREQTQLRRQREFEAQIQAKEQEMRQRQLAATAIPDSASRKAKLSANSEEPAYVSRNRRRPAPSSANSSKPGTPVPDLLGGGRAASSQPTRSNNPFEQDISRSASAPRSNTRSFTPTPAPPPRKPKPQRPAISIPPGSLQQSSVARAKGTDAYKRGDYSAAQAHYTTSINPIPEQHPLRIILLTNRSLSTLKLGDPKSALSDLDAILGLIGEARGEDETIDLDGQAKDMKDYWGKAVTRKAEALEQMEKWNAAKECWELALSAGVSHALAAEGKRRCEQTLQPKPKPATKQKPKAAVRAAPPTKVDTTAVNALRKANADAEKADAERLALHDIVEERINAWKNGKEGNLRALLAGLDNVLWEGSGWKKVGLGELLQPNKVKITYMKGIAKVHPDKIGQSATVEQKMVSAAVFSLLNDAWEAFKKDNGL